MGNGSFECMDIKAAVTQIARWNSQRTAGVQDYDIMFFIKTVAEVSKLREGQKIDFLEPLKRYFTNKKDIIKEYLIKKYGKQARAMGSQIHMALFGKPWIFEIEKEKSSISSGNALKDIITAITTFVPEHKAEIAADVQAIGKKYGFTHPGKIAKKLEKGIVRNVQVVLKHTKDRTGLENVLAQKNVIHSALNNVYRAILIEARAMRIPESRGKGVEDFIAPIMEMIILEIEAEITFLPKAA